MKPKTLFILFLVAAGLLTYVYYGIQKPSEEIAEKGRPEDRLIPGDLTKVEWIQIKTSSVLLRLERQAIGWRITQPVQDIAAQSKVESLINALEKFKKTKVVFNPSEISQKAPQRDQFGLQNPRVTMSYKLSSLPESFEVSVGSPNPSATGTFAETKTQGIVVATMDLDYLANQTVNEFREMRLTTVSASDFAEVTVENASGKFKLAKENDRWKMIEPTLPADSEVIQNFVDKISFVRATDFVDAIPVRAGKPLARLVVGFEKDVKDLRTSPGDKRPSGLEFAFYREAVVAPKSSAKGSSKKSSASQEKPEDLYFVLSDKAGAAKTNSYHFDNFQKNATDFVKKAFDDFLLASVKSISLKSKAETFDITRAENATYQSGATTLDKTKTEAVLNQIRNIKADSFLSKETAFPLDADLTLTVHLSAGQRDFAFKKSNNRLLLWFRKESDILKYNANPKVIDLAAFHLNSLKETPKASAAPPANLPSKDGKK